MLILFGYFFNKNNGEVIFSQFAY